MLRKLMLVLLLPAAACGDMLLIGDPQSGSAQFADTNWVQYTFGNCFRVGENDVEVDALGYYDYADGGGTGDGLAQSHAVGIWDEFGTLLVSDTVPAGAGTVLSNGYRYVALGTSVVLSAHSTYCLGADTTGIGSDRFYLDRDTTDAGSVRFNAAVTLLYRCQSANNVGLAWPIESQIAEEAWLPANMLVRVRRASGSGRPTTGELETVEAWTAPWRPPPTGGVIMVRQHPHGDLNANRSTAGTPLKVAHTVYEYGLGTHSHAVFEVILPGAAETFSAVLGIDQNELSWWGTNSSVTLTIDTSEPDQTSPVITNANSPMPFTADLYGATSFIVRVGNGGDNYFYDHLDLVDASPSRRWSTTLRTAPSSTARACTPRPSAISRSSRPRSSSPPSRSTSPTKAFRWCATMGGTVTGREGSAPNTRRSPAPRRPRTWT
jgi:hypothetical protein